MMKYSSLASYGLVCFKNESTIVLAISSRQSISAPILLSTIRHIAQLTAFLTSSYLSNNRAFRPVKVSWLIFESPSLVDSNSPSNRVASRRILTTLQWVNADAKPTHPCSIMLPIYGKGYFFLLSHFPFRIK